MANKAFGAISHIGGADGDLDSIAASILSDGDIGIVIDAVLDTASFYTLNSSSSAVEDAVYFTVIKPDDEIATPGKRWIQTAFLGTDITMTGDSLLGGTLTVTGDVSVNTNKFTVTASNGDTNIAGNLTVNTNKFSVAGLTGNVFSEGDMQADAITAAVSLRITGSGPVMTAILDEDDMNSDSDVSLATQQSIKKYIDDQVAAGSTVPSGTIISWGGTGSVPSGYLDCNGQTVNRTTYADLFTAIGERYGDGDTSTTFEVPDLRGYFLRGWDNSAGNDPDAASRTDSGDGTTGDNIGTKQADEVEEHLHGGDSYYALFDGVVLGNDGAGHGYGVENSITNGNTSNFSGGNETRPKNIAVRYIIKT